MAPTYVLVLLTLLGVGNGYISRTTSYRWRNQALNTQEDAENSNEEVDRLAWIATSSIPPKTISSYTKSKVIATASNVIASTITSLGINRNSAAYGSDEAVINKDEIKMPNSAYTTLGEGTKMCRILNGMWQTSGYHGYEPNKENAVAAMSKCANEGYSTFDLADIYGPAEDYVGSFCKGRLASPLAKDCQFFTKWVPRPQEITRKIVTENIDKSLSRMKSERLDLLQFHWWDYNNKYYYNAMAELMHLQQDDKILNIGLTNFDTDHMVDLIEQNVPIVSNQVAFSVLDTRPLQKMVIASEEKGVKLLVYGSLLGGFLSSEWLGKPAPSMDSLTNVSLRKYLPWIYYWGGWTLFQELLLVLNTIAQKHSVSLSNVALKWVLDQPAVGGAIVGVRLGLKDHLSDNLNVFNLSLDGDDLAAIEAVQKKSKNLINVFGDCGGEYRKRG